MRRRTPQEKKNLEYTKDHVDPAHNSVHGFRKNWPRKKARVNRAYLRRIHSLTVSVMARQKEDFPDEANPAVVQRELVRKVLRVKPYGEVVRSRLAGRIERTGRNFFSWPLRLVGGL